jgi:hypothetical protein
VQIQYADCQPDYTHEPGAEVKKVWKNTFTPPAIFIANLTFLLPTDEVNVIFIT